MLTPNVISRSVRAVKHSTVTLHTTVYTNLTPYTVQPSDGSKDYHIRSGPVSKFKAA